MKTIDDLFEQQEKSNQRREEMHEAAMEQAAHSGKLARRHIRALSIAFFLRPIIELAILIVLIVKL